MKSHYEEAVATHKRKIENIKKALDESQAHSQLLMDRIRTLLQANREWFTTQVKLAFYKGWAAWVTQAVELHTYRADWENGRKEGKGFYKLSKERIATVQEDLPQNYQTLTNPHSEEFTQLLKDFGESQEDIFSQLSEISSEHERVEELKKVEAIMNPRLIRATRAR